MSSSAELLTGYRNILKNDNRLRTIKSFKRGIFYPSASFPVLSILPISEGVHRMHSNNVYYYKRSYSIQIYTKGRDLQKTREQAIKLIEITKPILQEYTDVHNNNNAFNISFEKGSNFAEVASEDEGITGIAMQGFTSYSKETLPSRQTREDLTCDIRIDEVGKMLYNLLLQAKKTLRGKIGKLNSIWYPIPSPIPSSQFPALAIVPSSDTKERYRQGLDDSVNAFQIQLYTKLSDKEINLMFLLELLDDVRNILFKTQRLSDLSWKFDFNNVSFQFLTGANSLRAYLAIFEVAYHVFESTNRR